MKNKFRLTRVFLSFTLLLSLLFAMTSCGTPAKIAMTAPSDSLKESDQTPVSTVDAVSAATAERYRTGEVRDYQGMLLDPAVGPRDNSISGVQDIDIDTYTLTVSGLVDKPVELTYEEVKALTPYERLITLYCVEGWDATILWKGVLIEDLMNMAGIQPEAVTVIFHAADNYTTSMPLQTVLDRKMILAYMSNGLPLPPEMGYPFIVVAEDKLGYKWARWVTEIELSSDPDYQGFWEQNGYSNDAEIED